LDYDAIINFVIVLIGLGTTAVLFYHFPKLPAAKNDPKTSGEHYPTVSIIIPARNEEKNLPLLLEDLSAQTLPAYEILCVDDDSEDATPQIALSYGVKLISLKNKPEGWTGKTWACQNGADAAKGELLLFLDADVRLGKDGYRKLMQAYTQFGCAISVQPYHRTEKIYEQLSMMFNLILIAANGNALPKPLYIGLYGPVIVITRADYIKAGGHKSARYSVVEDITLGLRLKKMRIPYRLFIGDKDVSFRMYSGGLRLLFQGWVKNFVTGASITSWPVFLMVFIWITSLTAVPLQFIKYAVSGDMVWMTIYFLLYIAWGSILAVLASRVGRFHFWVFVLYPISLMVLLGVFAISLFRRIFRLKVIWKGRSILTKEKPCE
jgi:4,4'-diaponeurosporenoate glycosyltransferase